MLTLASKLKRDDGVRGPRASNPASDSTRRVSVRDKLLVKGERNFHLNLAFSNYLNICGSFSLLDEGYYQGGKFQFEIEVPDAYNMVDLLNFDDPLNIEAAEHHLRDKVSQYSNKNKLDLGK
uniref:Uncharacterized protein n=1 Tax=Pavo cristatus TaxID=9049 RepID=A0A8C9FTR2_PAVCR